LWSPERIVTACGSISINAKHSHFIPKLIIWTSEHCFILIVVLSVLCQTYYVSHVIIVMWPTSVSWVASLSFTNKWPHGIVKCTLNAHFRISPEAVGMFCLLFYEYCEFRHTILFTYCFFCLLYIREVWDFGYSHAVQKWLSTFSEAATCILFIASMLYTTETVRSIYYYLYM